MSDKFEEAINFVEQLLDRCDDLHDFLDSHMDILQAVNDGPSRIEYIGFATRARERLAEVSNMFDDMRISLIDQLDEGYDDE